MSTSVKLFAAVAVIVIGALGAAEVVRRSRDVPGARDPTGAAAARSSNPEQAAAPEEQPVSPSAADYSMIGQRDIFRPLVKAPQGSAGAGAPGQEGKAGAAGAKPKGEGKPSGSPSGAQQPPDPLADLVLTGIIQTGDRLQALIEKVSTKTGRYVAVNEYFEGFRVVSIGANSVVLEREGKQYTLSMGTKQLGEPPSLLAPAPAGVPCSPSESAAGPAGPQAPGSEGAGGFFGSDMLAWADRQPLSDLERMYAQYSQSMSPEDRARAEEYLESRRQRERGQ
jgi:hypothetical protein